MQRSSIKWILIGSLGFAAAGVGAVVMVPKLSGEPSALEVPQAVLSAQAVSATAEDSSALEGDVQYARGPVIPANLQSQRDFITRRWSAGANLAGYYVQMAVPCGRDCFNLIIADMQTGEIHETGMGFDSMPVLEVDTRADNDLVLMMWENLSAANCRRAVYRWDGQQLGAVSDILEYDYTDAGCGQFNLSLVMDDIH